MYKTINQNTIYELTEKKSKFIANLVYIQNKEDAEYKIKEYKKKYFDARHNCYAYRVLENETVYEKSSDDGEPSGTAGAPMLNILQKNNLCNVLVIVTRYFGGILLGTGGLVRCYSGACIGAMENSDFFEIEPGVEMIVTLDYTDFQSVQYYFGKNNIKILNSKYENDIECLIEMNILTKDKFLADVKNRIINIKKVEISKSKYVKIYHK